MATPAKSEEIPVENMQVVRDLGLEQLVIRFWNQLKNKDIPRDTLQAVVDAFLEAAKLQNTEANGDSANINSAESFVVRAHRLEKLGRSAVALDLIYDSVDELLHAGKFEQLDSILRGTPAAELSIDLLLGVLTATLPAGNRLHSRSKLFDEIKNILSSRGVYEESLLSGLQGQIEADGPSA